MHFTSRVIYKPNSLDCKILLAESQKYVIDMHAVLVQPNKDPTAKFVRHVLAMGAARLRRKGKIE